MITLTDLSNSMKEISNYSITKIKLEPNKLTESKKCTNCVYEGLMECWNRHINRNEL